MERPNKKDYDFNDLFDAVRFANDMNLYCDHLEGFQSPSFDVLDFRYTGIHEENAGGRPFLNIVTGRFHFRCTMERYFTKEQIESIKPYEYENFSEHI